MATARREVTVSALQFACTDDISTNVATAERLVRSAHAKGANIILIQELFEGFYFCQAQREDYIQRAKPYKGHPTILRMQLLAKELGVVIPVSFFEEANNAHYNSIAIIDADGSDLGIYRKSHIPDGPGYQEKFYFNPGDTGFKVFQTKFAKIGVAICWDQWFPEAARAMVLQGAEILFYPTAIGSEPQDDGLDSRDHWKRVMQGHAGANLVPIVASNRIGSEIIETEHGKSKITFYGNSFIAGPTGEIVASANDKDEDVLLAEFDLDKIKSKRHAWGVFRDRRPELYKGCDASLLLNGSNTEKEAPPNLSVRDYDLIDSVKIAVERECPGVVSCADIIAMATRDAVNWAGGERYAVETGRRDGLKPANNVDLPGPSRSVPDSIAAFSRRNLSVSDMVYLLGE